MQVFRFFTILSLITIFSMSCGDNTPDDGSQNDNFDRGQMLTYWADALIIPSLDNYQQAVSDLTDAVSELETTTELSTLQTTKEAWLEAYLAWQSVAMYNIGPAESYQLSSYTNIYPTDVDQIESLVNESNVNLALPSTNVAQGYPAIEYLLYMDEMSETEVLQLLLDNPARIDYLQKLVAELQADADNVLEDWRSGYRESFISASGSSATASVNKMTNDFLYYFERSLRAGKVGIPAGVFSTEPLPFHTEGLYAKTVSRDLFLVALDAFQDFFNGRSYDESATGDSYSTYITFLDKGSTLAVDINTQLDLAKSLALELPQDFSSQVQENPTALLAIYDELQKAVVLMKVDMMQQLNIKIDYVDADGD